MEANQIRPDDSVAIVESVGFMSAARLAQLLGQETRVRIIAISPMNSAGAITTVFAGPLAEVQYALQVAQGQNLVHDFAFFARPNLDTIEMLMRSAMIGGQQPQPKKQVKREDTLPLFEQGNGQMGGMYGGSMQGNLMQGNPMQGSPMQGNSIYGNAMNGSQMQGGMTHSSNMQGFAGNGFVNNQNHSIASAPVAQQPSRFSQQSSQYSQQPRAEAVSNQEARPTKREVVSELAPKPKAAPPTRNVARKQEAAPVADSFEAKGLLELEGYTVHELRRYARSIPGFPIQGREISRANRGDLLQLIKSYDERVRTNQAQNGYAEHAHIDAPSSMLPS